MEAGLVRRPADKVVDGVKRFVPDGQDHPAPAALAALRQRINIERIGHKDRESPQPRQLAESVPLVGVEEVGRGQVLPAELIPEADLTIEQKVLMLEVRAGQLGAMGQRMVFRDQKAEFFVPVGKPVEIFLKLRLFNKNLKPVIGGQEIADLTQIGKELDYTRMNRYGLGVWAGTLRYHKDRFYIFFGTPDEGFFMTSAPKAEGPWEPLTQLMSEKGWDDCSVMWDTDGKAYFVGTHFADGYKTYLYDMSTDGKSIDLKSARLVNEGGYREANKLIKVGDWYYLVFSEHRSDKGRYVMAKRSRCITGPYEEEKQLALPSREYKEPNQGGIVEGKSGEWYFLTHHGTGDWAGRVASLLPVTWIDGWPIIGTVIGDSIGSM